MKAKSKLLALLTLAAPILLSFVVSACEDGTMEEAGEEVDEAIEDVEDSVDGE